MNIQSATTPELLAAYNEAAKVLGRPHVKRFSDRKSAERRTAEILTGAAALLAKSAPKSKKKKAAKPAADKIPTDDDFGCREGTNRWNLLAALRASKGAAVPQSLLLKAVYGAAYKEYRAPLAMVMKGLNMAIAAGSLPFVIEKSRENKELCFALKRKTKE